MTRHRLLASLSLCASLVACSADMSTELEGDDSSDAASELATRKAVMKAIHDGFLDEAVNGQANELLVSHFAHDRNWAWVSATVQAPGGGDLDWSNSMYGDDIEEGFFDGPHLEALLRFNEEEDWWEVDIADVGSTDVWFDGIWFRRALPCDILPFMGDQCTTVSDVEFGSDERRSIMGAIHDGFLDQAVHGQANELLVSTARVGGGYAFVTASVQAVGGGELDWSDSDYADDIEDGLFDGPQLTALLRKMDGAWVVVENDIGATDVSWWGAWERHDSVPCALFPVDRCE